MLPVPWIGTGTQEATHSANPGRGQGFSEGRLLATHHLGGVGSEMDDQAFPAEPWKNASPVGIGLSQVPHGACLGSSQSRATGSHSPPSSLGGGGTGRESSRGQGPCHPSCSHSAIALISENLQECSSNGITWNCSFWGKIKQTHKVFCVRYWSGWESCVLGCCFFCYFLFLFCFLIMFTICLNHSVFYKDSTSSPLPSSHPGLQGC